MDFEFGFLWDAMKQEQIIQELVTAITPELWYLFLQMLVTICLTLLVYQLLKNIAAYVMVRFDKEISKNVHVMYDGEKCRIVHINIRHLIIKKPNENDVLIPISKVGQTAWEIVKEDGYETQKIPERAE